MDDSVGIAEILSSCECVRPKVVRYLRRKKEKAVAVRLDFVNDSKANHYVDSVLLGVEIKVLLENGAQKMFTVEFFLASQIGNEPRVQGN